MYFQKKVQLLGSNRFRRFVSEISGSHWIDCLRSFKVVNRTIDGFAYCLRMIVNTQRNVRLFVVNVSIAMCEIVAD